MNREQRQVSSEADDLGGIPEGVGEPDASGSAVNSPQIRTVKSVVTAQNGSVGTGDAVTGGGGSQAVSASGGPIGNAATGPAPPRLFVGLGASAGGLQALEEFFKTLEPPTGMVFCVVQHLSPHFKSLMDELLSRHSRLRIQQAENGTELLADHVYLMPPGVEMIVSGNRLLLTDKDPKTKLSFPIDQFFRSMAQEWGERAIAIILSGTGSDGSRGIVDVHNAGGLVLVQEEGSAKFTGMPYNAMQSGVVGHSVRPREMPALLQSHLENFDQALERQLNSTPPSPPPGLREVFELLKDDFKIDFSLYRPTTIARRTQRRLLLAPGRDLASYVQLLNDDPIERELLYHDLLIGVTSFFRDDPAFCRLEHELLPPLLESIEEGGEFRAWVAGCASGEEAYSLAILVDEILHRQKKSVTVKIFATDVHKPSLEAASFGAYPPESLSGLSEKRLSRYFTLRDGRYHVDSRLREMLIFAPHNVLRDSPFTRLHFVSCRNLLIYFQPPAQRKVLSLFHFALRTGGLLFLGASESLGDYSDEFDAVDDHWRIFRKRRDVRLHASTDVVAGAVAGAFREFGFPAASSARSINPLNVVFERILTETLPSSILIGDGRQVLHTFGDASSYLELKAGRPSLDLLDMVSGDIKMLLASGLQRAERQGAMVQLSSLKLRADGQSEPLDVTVRPIRPTGFDQLYFLVTFQSQSRPPVTNSGDERAGDDAIERLGDNELTALRASHDRIESLERELVNMQENLQITVEELETSNEELEASNEELLAANEELQSTNEELHSVNEELFTVNTEHQKKIEELRLLNRDVENLLLSTEIHTLFLDESLRIRKFTPEMAEVFNLIPSDLGRRIDSFVHTIGCPDLQDKLARALHHNERFEEEVEDIHDTRYLMRIYPYQADQPKSGVVFTLIDITPLKHAEQQFRVAVETAPGAILMVDNEGLIRLANSLSEKMFGYRADELVGRPIETLIPERMRGDHRALRDRYFDDAKLRPMGQGRQLLGLRKDGEEFPVDIQLSPLQTPDGRFALAAVIDQSETKRLERSLRDQLENRDLFLAMLSHELRNPLGAVLNSATILDRVTVADLPHRELIELIVGQARQMSRLLDDLLDVSRVFQGKVQLRQEVIDLSDVIGEAVTATEYLFRGRQQDLAVSLTGSPCPIFADRSRMLQVFENLLTNASKYTPDQGAIRVSLRASHGHATVVVRDNGRGILRDKLESIFDMFTQGDNSIDRRDAGMGVGLTLVKSLIEMHGGTVVARSDGAGAGSEFIVGLRLSDKSVPVVKPVPLAKPPESMRIVLVEDNEESRRTLKMLMELEGYSIQTASDGQEGLALILREQPDAAILDIGLPLIDGYELARQLREQIPPERLYLIALTGYGRDEDRKAVHEAGFDDHQVKPIQVEGLLASLHRALQRKPLRQDTAR